jgi:hypothetical protein
MTVSEDHSTADAAGAQSPRQPAPGRVAHIQRVNAERKRRRELGELRPGEDGGRPMEHGEYALAERIRRGLDPSGPLFPLLAERREAYLADLGGPGNASEKEADMCGDLASLRLTIRRIDGELHSARRLPWKRRVHLYDLRVRYALAFKDIAIRLGLQRRAAEVDRTVIIKRWTAEPTNGTEQGADHEHKTQG